MAKTLKDFWNEADGVYDFVDKNGVSIDDMNYPLETEALNERLIEGEQYEITTRNICRSIMGRMVC